jgi:tRNA-specific adenosine deaminase 1
MDEVTPTPDPQIVARSALAVYATLNPRVPDGQWTVLAAFVLCRPHAPDWEYKVISLATGVKCLPTDRLSSQGDVLHDSHAEVIARRGAVRWFLQQVINGNSLWLQQENGVTSNKLCPGVRVAMYVSTVPCKQRRYSVTFPVKSNMTVERW